LSGHFEEKEKRKEGKRKDGKVWNGAISPLTQIKKNMVTALNRVSNLLKLLKSIDTMTGRS